MARSRSSTALGLVTLMCAALFIKTQARIMTESLRWVPPRCAAVSWRANVGTTARPALVTPQSHDVEFNEVIFMTMRVKKEASSTHCTCTAAITAPC
jgi:hypothetical protein